jgi:phosphatidylglycerophosphate synthase
MAAIPGPTDSYSSLERRFRARSQRALVYLLGPAVELLWHVGVSPHAVSALQILLAMGFLYLLPHSPRWSLLLWALALLADGLDGALARKLGRASAFGALWDQACDHGREILVVAALAHYGAASAFWATLYASAYPGLNLGLALTNHYGVPLGFAIKTYLVFYPALIAYLGWGVNCLTPALALATLAMAAGIGASLWRLRSVMA